MLKMFVFCLKTPLAFHIHQSQDSMEGGQGQKSLKGHEIWLDMHCLQNKDSNKSNGYLLDYTCMWDNVKLVYTYTINVEEQGMLCSV